MGYIGRMGWNNDNREELINFIEKKDVEGLIKFFKKTKSLVGIYMQVGDLERADFFNSKELKELVVGKSYVGKLADLL